MRKGFSLVELMIVIGLIAILTTIGGTTYLNYGARSRDTRRRTDMQNIRAALELFRANNLQGTYPTTAQYGTGTVSVLVPAFLARIPVDPRNQAYIYVARGVGGVACNNVAIMCIQYTLTTDLETVAGANDYILTPTSIN